MRLLFLVLATVLLSACDSVHEIGPGAKYLAAYAKADNDFVNKGAIRPFKAGTHNVAAVTPIFRFQERLGLVRMEGGRLTDIPVREMALWHRSARKSRWFGEFVPVGPAVAELAVSKAVASDLKRYGTDCYDGRCEAVNGAFNIVSRARMGAARQHVDAMVIYEVGSYSQRENTVLSFADLTIIGGAILPTRFLKSQGFAQALLLDVRNGYSYGSAQARSDLSTLSVSWRSDERQISLRKKAARKVVSNLLPEVEKMFRKPKARLARNALAGGSRSSSVTLPPPQSK